MSFFKERPRLFLAYGTAHRLPVRSRSFANEFSGADTVGAWHGNAIAANTRTIEALHDSSNRHDTHSSR